MRSIVVFAPLFAMALFLSACSSGTQTMPPISAPQTQTQTGSEVPMDGRHIFYPLVGQQRYADRTRKSNPNLIYYGGPVMTNPKVYVVYWGWTSDPSGEAPYLNAFLGNVGGSSWLNIVTQYSSITNPAGQFGGSWVDTGNAIPSHPSDSAIAAEAVRAITHFTNSSGSWGNNVMVMVATPHGNSSRGFGTQWCAYHSYVTSNGSSLAYTNMPYQTDAGTSCGANFNGLEPGLLDGVSIVGGHEYAEAITDPYPSSGWLDANGSEIGDKCAWSSASTDISLGSSSYAVQPLWSNAISGCATSYP
jgi:hypothetical protein